MPSIDALEEVRRSLARARGTPSRRLPDDTRLESEAHWVLRDVQERTGLALVPNYPLRLYHCTVRQLADSIQTALQ